MHSLYPKEERFPL